MEFATAVAVAVKDIIVNGKHIVNHLWKLHQQLKQKQQQFKLSKQDVNKPDENKFLSLDSSSIGTLILCKIV